MAMRHAQVAGLVPAATTTAGVAMAITIVFQVYASLVLTQGHQYTKDRSCGPSFSGLTCDNPQFGPCCSFYSYCGKGPNYCAVANW
jgi:hypothetical protein